MHLPHNVVLVTGSSTGIGKETALAFAKEKSIVLLAYNTNKQEGEKTLQTCKQHTEAALFPLDVADDVENYL